MILIGDDGQPLTPEAMTKLEEERLAQIKKDIEEAEAKQKILDEKRKIWHAGLDDRTIKIKERIHRFILDNHTHKIPTWELYKFYENIYTDAEIGTAVASLIENGLVHKVRIWFVPYFVAQAYIP